MRPPEGPRSALPVAGQLALVGAAPDMWVQCPFGMLELPEPEPLPEELELPEPPEEVPDELEDPDEAELAGEVVVVVEALVSAWATAATPPTKLPARATVAKTCFSLIFMFTSFLVALPTTASTARLRCSCGGHEEGLAIRNGGWASDRRRPPASCTSTLCAPASTTKRDRRWARR